MPGLKHILKMSFAHIFLAVLLTNFCDMSFSDTQMQIKKENKLAEGKDDNKQNEEFSCLKTLETVVNSQKEIWSLKTCHLDTKVQLLSSKTDKYEMDLEEMKKKLASFGTSQKTDEIETVLAKLEKKLTDSTESLKTLEMKINSMSSQNIAFSARVSPTYEDIGPHETIKFSSVLTNNGNAFNPLTGVFTAPVTGTYMFFSSILTKKPSALEVGLQVNNQYKMMMYPDSRTGLEYNSGANSVILGLVKGDQVKMTKWAEYGARPFYIHNVWSTFSGFLIHV